MNCFGPRWLFSWPVTGGCHDESKDAVCGFFPWPDGVLRSDDPLEAPQTESVPAIAQNARMPSDHLALTRHYENTAREMGNKAEEQKRLFKHYEEKSYLYGRQAQDLKSHAAALVRKYNEVAAENIREAAAHRRLALEQIRRDKVTRDG